MDAAGAAIVAITLIGMFGTVAVLGTVVWDLNRQASELSDSLHRAVADLPADSSAAHTAEDLELDDRIDRVFDGAATRLVAGSNDPLAVAGGIAKVVVVGVLAAFIIAGGRRVVGMGIRFVRRTSIREQLHVAVATSIMRAGAYLRRMIAVSVGHGAVAALVALALGLPGSITIAAWVAVASTVPILGGLLAWLPVIALAKVNDVPLSLAIGIALLCIVGDRLARARWVHRALRVGPLIALVGIGVGLTLIGISGSILGLFVVALVSALLSHAADFRAALSDLIEDPSDRLIPDANDLAPLEEPVMAEPRGTETYIRLRLSSRTAITAAVAATLAMALFEMGRTTQSLIVWFTVGGFIAIGLDRPISKMHRSWKLPRFAGTTVVLGLLVAVVSAVVVLGGPSITNSAATVANRHPKRCDRWRRCRWSDGCWNATARPTRWRTSSRHCPTGSAIPAWSSVWRVLPATVPPARSGRSASCWRSCGTARAWCGLRADRVAPAKRAEAVRFGRAAYTALSNVVAAAAFVAALNGTVVMLLAIALGIPLAPVLGLWAAGGTSFRRSAASSGPCRSLHSASVKDRGPASSPWSSSSRIRRSRTT